LRFHECATFKQENLTLSTLCLLFLGIQSSRRLGVARELPRIVVKSQEVCITLLFVGIDSENQVGLGGNLRGLWLKETRLFVSFSTGCRQPLWLAKFQKQILCLLVPHAFIFRCMTMFFVFLSSIHKVSYLSLF
jgi:hypothetical protein